MIVKVISSGTWRICSPVMGNREQCTFEDFCDELGPQFRASLAGVVAMMDHHSRHGRQAFNTDQCHYVDQQEQIYEYIKGRLRVFWFEDDDHVVICTHGIVKKDQRTPKREIDKAKRIKAAYLKAKANAEVRIVEEEDEE